MNCPCCKKEVIGIHTCNKSKCETVAGLTRDNERLQGINIQLAEEIAGLEIDVKALLERAFPEEVE